MKSCLSLFTVFIRNRLASRSFWAVSLMLLALIAGLSLLCPSFAPPSAAIGLIFDGSDSALSQSFERLLELEELNFIRYPDDGKEQLARDVMSGALHCGYAIDADSDTPITVYETPGSILAPALDELVFSAWYNARLINQAPSRYGGGAHADLISAELSRLLEESRPLAPSISVSSIPEAAAESASPSQTPLIYAAFFSLLLLSAALSAALSPDSERELLRLCGSGGNGARLSICRFFAHAAVFFALSLCCDFAVSSLSAAIYPVGARLLASAVLSLLASALFSAFSRFKVNAAALFLLLLWSAASVALSGAVFSPSLLGGLEWIKYTSPSYHLLRLLAAA